MRRYKVELLPAAWDDLQEIFDFILLDSLTAASKVLEKIIGSLHRLEDFPNSGSSAPGKELKEHGFRMVVCMPYVSFYRVIDNTVFVYHIVHGARDYPELLKNHLKR